MYKYGIDNVRGGSFTTLDISKLEKQFIIKQLHSIHKCCYKCSGKYHLASQCKLDNIALNAKCLVCGDFNRNHNTQQHNLTIDLSFPDGGFAVTKINIEENSIICYIDEDNELRKINKILEKYNYKPITNEFKLYGKTIFNQIDDDTYEMPDTDDCCIFSIGRSSGGGSLENVSLSIIIINDNEYKLYLNWGQYYTS